ncbi:TPA: hypothetical protein MEA92_000684 [Klebsiella aerogenes]|nr:hypothetical protein [Klebsiella aerogenes]
MTDITELAQSLKAAAEGVIKNYDCEWFETGRQICTVHKSKVNLISLANPDNILALVEALEKAQQVDEELCKLLPPGAEYMDPPDGGDVTPLEGVRRMVADYRQRIAELESRTVTVKLPEVRITVAESRRRNMTWRELGAYNEGADVAAERIGKELTAQGIKWEAE